jgi:hypothetical protein
MIFIFIYFAIGQNKNLKHKRNSLYKIMLCKFNLQVLNFFSN